MLCASHQPAALCEFFFITTSSLLRIYELIVSEDEGFVKKFAKNFSICYQNLKESSLPTRLGILASQNCLLTDIADFLLEPSKKINVVDRLPSHLERGGVPIHYGTSCRTPFDNLFIFLITNLPQSPIKC